MLSDYDVEFVKRFSKKYLDMDIDKQLLSHQNDYIHKYKFVELAMHPSELYEYRTILDINLYMRQDGSDEVGADVIRLSVNFLYDDFDIAKFYYNLSMHCDDWLTGEELMNMIIKAIFMAITISIVAYHKMMEEYEDGKQSAIRKWKGDTI